MNSAHWPGVINNGHTTGKSIEEQPAASYGVAWVKVAVLFPL